MKEVAVRAPRFQSRLHRWRGDRLLEETHRRLIGFQLSRRERFPRITAGALVYLASEDRANWANNAAGPGYTSTQPASRSEASVKPPQSTPIVPIFALPAASAS
jgi:hypothetical protein